MSTLSKSTERSAVSSLIWSIHRGKRIYSINRIVQKNGEFNIVQTGIKKRKQQYLADIFTTLIDLKWSWSLFIFMAVFILTWVLFAVLWWTMAKIKGDLDNLENGNWTHCVTGVDGFFSAMLFSIETQHTIGYGTRSITQNCTEALLVLMVQSTLGVIIQALMTGMVFSKLARPHKRAQTLMFSKRACICQRDGSLVLLLRVGDMRASHLIGARIDALVIRRKVTMEGEVIPLATANLDLGHANKRLLLRWPVLVEHKITQDSPLYKLSKQDLEKESFELLIILEGSVPSTGANTQAVTSYRPEEIKWGYRFHRLMTHLRDDGKYVLDYREFETLEPVRTPECSAEQLSRRRSSVLIPTSNCPNEPQADYSAIRQWMRRNTIASEEDGKSCTSSRTETNSSPFTVNDKEQAITHGNDDVESTYIRVRCKSQQIGDTLEELCSPYDNEGYVPDEGSSITVNQYCDE